MKNFIRGMGVGIVLTTIVVAITYGVSKNKITDEEIIKRAERLGMVQKAEDIFTKNKSNTETSKEDAQEDGAENEARSEEPAGNDGQEQQTAGDVEESPTEETVTLPEIVILTVKGGEGGLQVSNQLAQIGVITDAEDFNRYLRSNNLQTRIQVGSYELTKGMSYDDIIKKIIQ